MRKFLYSLLAFGILAGAASAQERFSLFVPSDQENVERMLKLANLHDDDVVVDLGSGDGRVVLTAARMNPKVRGWGVDIDAKLVAESNAAAAPRALPTACSSSTATRSTPTWARRRSSPCGSGRRCSGCCARSS